MGLGAALGGTDVVPVSTRGHSMKMRSTESRERESRGSKTLWRGQGAAPLGFPQSTRGSSMQSSPTQSRERVKGGTPLRGQGAAPLGSPKKNEEGRENCFSRPVFAGLVCVGFVDVRLPSAAHGFRLFSGGGSPARTRPRCTGCRGRSRSPCRNTRRTDAPAHASW